MPGENFDSFISFIFIKESFLILILMDFSKLAFFILTFIHKLPSIASPSSEATSLPLTPTSAISAALTSSNPFWH